MVSTPSIGRRRLLHLMADVATVGSLGLLIPGCGGADTYVPPPMSGAVGTRQRSASIPSIIPFNNIDGQRTLEWCWAACAETIVRQFGIDVNNINGTSVAQEYFAIKVYGAGNVVQGAAPWQVAAALTDTYRLLNGQPISLQGYSWMPIPIQFNAKAVALIQAQIPFTILLIPYGESSGHFLTVYEITWTEDAAGNIVSIDSYRMADPAQNLYQFLPGIEPFPTQWGPAAAQLYAQAGVAWAERVG
jgi:hypothetical protein